MLIFTHYKEEKKVILNFIALKQLSNNLSLLYVEDDKLLRDKTLLIFKNLFKQVDVAEDGIDGLTLYKNQYKSNSKYYDIVVSDIQMPRLDGIGLTKEIYAINKKQKIIIISAYNDKEYLIDLINIGVDGFLQKPLSSENILEILYDVCNSFKNENIITLGDRYTYHSTTSILFLDNTKVELSDRELKLLRLLIENKNQSFSAIEIFNHIYFDEPDREFSMDSIKSLVKRLRKKTPDNFISNTQNLGYSANFSS